MNVLSVIDQAHALILRFCQRTGVTGEGPERRYLWTDAFAVSTLLGLGEHALALRLIESVHRTLGQHRGDDGRRGWLDGADEAHPTRGGLRIGKPHREGPGWEEDGQYFHYLTQWMHALDRAGEVTRRPILRTWARELGQTAHRRFLVDRHLSWKMSIDLTRPLVASSGQHDPLDGFVTLSRLGLHDEAADLARLIDPRTLATDDPLGLGGLLVAAYRIDELGDLAPLFDAVLAAATVGLRDYQVPSANHRLAFRELGLAIGLAAVARTPRLESLLGYLPMRDEIVAFWRSAEPRRAAAYRAHEDIDDVMLATSLAPAGYLA